MAHNFQNLAIWKRGCELAEATYKAFSGSREFDFKSQMVRSSLSIPSNIAEGSERRSEPDSIRFLSYAKSSAAELFTQATIANNLSIISPDTAQHLQKESLELASMIEALIQRLAK
jgi:four helix bundle protein